MLTQSELKSQLNYDPDTGIFTWLVSKGRKAKINDIAGYKRVDGYNVIRLNSKDYLAHRLAWLYVNGEFPKESIDHINGNPSDNRIINLRNLSHRENMQNQRNARVGTTSGVLGVHWHKGNNKWCAQIKANGKQMHIGYFSDKNEAHNAYLTKKRELHSACTI